MGGRADVAADETGGREVPESFRFSAVLWRAEAQGTSTWRTSVFPDTARGSYVLPVKKAVRVAENLEEDEPVAVGLEVLE